MRRTACIGLVAVAAEAAEIERIEFDTVRDPLAEASEFLPVDWAFVFSWRRRLTEDGVDELVARWDVAPGYYLYRHGFRADAGEGLAIGQLAIPRGEMRTDEYFGESEIYLGSVEIVVPVSRRTATTATVVFGYQGCAEAGLCYPSVERAATFHFAEAPEPVRWQGVLAVVGVVLLAAAGWLAHAMRSRRSVR